MITIELPWAKPPISSNGSRGGHHAHAGKVREARKTARIVGRAHLIAYGPLPVPCEVRMVWVVTDKRERDSGNLAPIQKATIDGFVDAGLWAKDHAGVIPVSSQEIRQGDAFKMAIEIREIEA